MSARAVSARPSQQFTPWTGRSERDLVASARAVQQGSLAKAARLQGRSQRRRRDVATAIRIAQDGALTADLVWRSRVVPQRMPLPS